MPISRIFSTLLFLIFWIVCPVQAQWTPLSTGTTGNLYSVEYMNSGHVWIGQHNGILYSANNGASFTPKSGIDATLGNAPIIGSFEAIHAITPNNAVATGVYFLGNDLIIYGTGNAGNSWSHNYYTNSGGLPRFMSAMAYDNSANGVAVGTSGRVLYTSNNGSTWSLGSSIGTNYLEDVAWAGGTTYIAVSSSGVFRSTNGGSTWTNMNVVGSNFRKVSFAPGSSTGYILNGNAILRSTDAGLTWTLASEILGIGVGNLTAIHAVNPDTFFVGSDSGLYRSTGAAQYWESFQVPGLKSINMIRFYDEDHGIAVGDTGFAVITSNSGGAAGPVAMFNMPPGPYCEGSVIQPASFLNPAWSIQWQMNGVLQSTQPNPSFTLANTGITTITLIVSNGVSSDTLNYPINVLPLPNVLPFTVKRDTTCHNTPGSFQILNSQANTQYRIYDGINQIGSIQGNGGTVTLATTSNQTVVKPLTIRGIVSNSCGADTISVVDSIYLAVPAANVTAAYYRDTVCVDDTTTMLVFNSQVGWEYYLFSQNSVRIPGNGGTIGIPVPATSNNVTHYVYAIIPGLNCARQIGGAQVLAQIDAYATINPGTLQAGVGQPLNVSVSPVMFNVFSWDFGPNASPQFGSGMNPAAVSFNTHGIDTVTLYAQLNNTCFATFRKPVYIHTLPASSSITVCTADSGSYFNASTQTRLEMDDHNNLLVAAYNASSGSFKIIPTIFKSDSVQQGKFQHAMQTLSNSPGLQGLINATAGDRLNNTYFGVHMTTTNGYWDVQGKYMRYPDAIVKLNAAGKFDWAIESPYAEISDIITTDDNKVHVLGIRAWKGYEMQTPAGPFRHAPDVNNRGEAFLMTVNTNGEVISSEVFGGMGANGLAGPAPFKAKYAIHSSLWDWDTLRCNIRMKEMQGGALKICGLMSPMSVNQMQPVYFGTDQLQNRSLFSNPNGYWTDLFVTTFTPGSGFSQSRVVLQGNPTFISDFLTDNNGNTIIIGRATGWLKTPVDDISFIPNNIENQFALSVDPAGNINWLIHADSMVFSSVGLNPDGSVTIAINMTTKFLIVDELGMPFNFSPSKVMGTYLARFNVDGSLMTGDFIVNATNSTTRQDVCGNYHVFYVTGAPNYRSHRQVISVGGSCAQNCYAAYSSSAKDASVASLSLSDTTLAGPSSRTMEVKIENRAATVINTLNFNFNVNGSVPQSVPWNGTLNPGDTITLSLGNYNFTRSDNRIKGWISAVNGSLDDEQLNDTVSVNQLICSGPLSGTFSLGCDTCYFKSFSSSTVALARCGVNGPVSIRVEPGLYKEQVFIDTITGVTATNTVEWISANGNAASTVLEFKSDHSSMRNTLCISRADYVSVKNITIRSNCIVPYSNFVLGNNVRSTINIDRVSHTSIRNCIIEGPVNTLQGNPTAHFMAIGTSSFFEFTGNKVSKGDGLYTTNGLSTHMSLNFDDNEFRETGQLSFYKVSNMIFNNNYVTNTGGVVMNDNDTLVISNNQLSHESATGTPLTVISFNGTASNHGLIFNNISASYPATFSSSEGMQLSGDFMDVYHNSIGNGVSLNSSSSNNSITFRNNLVRSGSDWAVAMDQWAVSQMNFNRYQSVNGDPLNFEWSGSQNLDLAQWKSTTGYDINSDSLQTDYLSYTDMHLLNPVTISGTTLGLLTDIDGQPRSATTPTIGADEYSAAPLMITVWPGDCDSTKSVDNYDLIPVGLYINNFHYTRPQINYTWYGASVMPWDQQQASGINMAHADANGDGIINLNDTLPITMNYGQSHPFAPPVFQRPQVGPEISLVPVGNNFNNGDTVRLKIMVGSALDPVVDLGAIGFQVPIPVSLMQAGSFTVKADSSFLCPDGNCIAYDRPDPASGIAAITIVRTDGFGLNGYGQVGEISFVKSAGWNGGPSVLVDFANYQGYEPSAGFLPLTGVPTTLFVTTGLEQIGGINKVTLYPNPASENVTAYFNWKKEKTAGKVQLIDMMGRIIVSEQHTLIPGENQLTLNISEVPAGVYLLLVGDNSESAIARLIKQ